MMAAMPATDETGKTLAGGEALALNR